MSDKFPSQLQDKFTVRFPEGMRDKIAEKAKENNRSMNAEIILALEKYLESNNEIDYEKVQFKDIFKIHVNSINKSIKMNRELIELLTENLNNDKKGIIKLKPNDDKETKNENDK